VFQAGIHVETQNFASLQIDARLNLSPHVLSGEHSGMTCKNHKEFRYNHTHVEFKLILFSVTHKESIPLRSNKRLRSSKAALVQTGRQELLNKKHLV
jgi:hypothetical protein